MESLAVANCQLTSVDNTELCLAQIHERLQSLDNFKELDLVCFPENSLYMRMKEGEAIEGLSLTDSAFIELQKWVNQRNAHLHLGSVPLKEKGFVSNASVLLRPRQSAEVSYRKIHLFDVDLDEERSIRESDVFRAGDALKFFEVNGWRVAQTICYDLRFSELFASYKAQGEVDLFLIPSAFTVPTGNAHWEILLRARAIEAQSYVVASAQGGHHIGDRGEKRTFGHGLSIDPWGEVLGMTTDDSPIVYTQLKRKRISQVRRQIPMQAHRKLIPFKGEG